MYLFGHLFTSLITNIEFQLCSKPDAISQETPLGTPSPTYYWGNHENPVFKVLKSRREMTKDEREAQITQTVCDLLVKLPHSSLICTRPPKSVRRNHAFIFDTSTDKTLLEEDLLADDCGVWMNNGQPRFFYERSGPGNAELTRAGRGRLVDETSLQKPWIVVHRHYVNKSCPEFRRTVTFIKGMACL